MFQILTKLNQALSAIKTSSLSRMSWITRSIPVKLNNSISSVASTANQPSPDSIGNRDEFLNLGGNEQSTHEYVSKLLGKATIDTNTYGKSMGRSGNYSTNYQQSGRERLTPDEVRLLADAQTPSENQMCAIFLTLVN